MAWVRYDDQFHAHPKVTAVIAENPAALALHVLANTWTNGQKRMGFIPRHQPGVLVCDRSQGAEWAAVLVRYGLWHETGSECDACREEYADLPEDAVGFVIHNAQEYRAPVRDRLTPGTAADLSEKRREAGRRGGLASAAKRNRTKASTSKQTEANRQASQAKEAKPGDAAPKAPVVAAFGEGASMQVTDTISRPAETQQTARANQANDVSKASNLLLAGVSPVPGTSPYGEVLPETLFASDEAKTPPTAGEAAPRPDDEVTARTIIGEWLERCRKRPPDQVIGQMGKQVKVLLEQKIQADDIRRGLALWMTKAKHPSTLPSFVNEAMNAQAATRHRPGSGAHIDPAAKYTDDPEEVFGP